MKKITSVFLFIIALALFATTALAAPPEYDGKMNEDFYVMLIDADTGKVLYENKADEQIYPASTTKIMTCIVTLENYSPDKTVTIPAECDWTSKPGDYSILKIRRGEKISMKDLLYGMMIVSGDDAADAIAIEVGGSMEGFVDMMNAKAKELGMDSTQFTNAGGLDKENPVVTVRDMAKLAIYAMKNPDFRDIVGRADYDMPKTNKQRARTVDNTNPLLDTKSDYYYEYTTGIKTGSTPKAGGCLVSSASKDGMNLICLVYGDKTSKKTQRWTVSKSLLEWGFDNYKTIDVSALLGNPAQAQVKDFAADDAQGGMLEFKQPDAGTAIVTLPKDTAKGLLDGTDTLEAATAYDKELTAPIAQGDTLGTITYKSKATGDEVFSYTLVASRDIPKAAAPEPTPGSSVTPDNTPNPSPTEEPVTKADNTLFVVIIIAVAGGLAAVVIILMASARRKKSSRGRRVKNYRYRR